MSDLVERLRSSNSNGAMCDEAAKRIVELEATLRGARGAMWELADWATRFEFNDDPMVKLIDAALGDGLPKSENM